MGKFKTFYKNNRIYVILMGIGIFCLIMVALAFLVYFIQQTKNNVYGNRLAGIENVAINDKHKNEIVDVIKKDEKVDKVNINIFGKVIYINVYLNAGDSDTAQSIAIKSLESLSEDEKEFYDINFIFNTTKEDENNGFPIMGYKKSDATIISWTKVNTGE